MYRFIGSSRILAAITFLLLISACGSNSAPPLPPTPSVTAVSNTGVGGGLQSPNPGTPIYQMDSRQILNALQSNLSGYGQGQVTTVTLFNYIIDPTFQGSSSSLKPIGNPTSPQFSPTTMTVTGSSNGNGVTLNILMNDGTRQYLTYTNAVYAGPVQLVTTNSVAMFQGSGVIAKVSNFMSRGGFTIQEFFIQNTGTIWDQGAMYPSNYGGGGQGLNVREVDISVSFNYPQYAQSGQGGW